MCFSWLYAWTKKYKMYNIERKVTLVSRDVFHESIFPYKGEQTDAITCSLPLPLNTSDTDANSTYIHPLMWRRKS